MITVYKECEHYDLCVIGAGPAGIICAIEYARKNVNKRVLLVEYGGNKERKPNELDETINIVDSTNHHEPYDCTNKILGGTSQTWGGRCVMYDPVDFEPRDVVGSDCTWSREFYEDTKR